MGPAKAKVRVFFAEVEGNNESVREALKTMVAAMGRSVQVVTTLPAKPSNGNGSAVTGEDILPVEEGLQAHDSGTAEQPDPEAAPARRARGEGPKKDRNVGIELVSNIDFRPVGKQPVKEFFKEKNPKSDMEQLLVLVYYMQHTLEIAKIGLGHVRTAFKEVGPAPVDIKSTVRNMKKDKAWLSFSTMDDIKVTVLGENYVEHDILEKQN